MNMEENEWRLLIVFLNHHVHLHLMIRSKVKHSTIQKQNDFLLNIFIGKLAKEHVSENTDEFIDISTDNKTSTKKFNYSTIENLELEHISMEKLLRVGSYLFFFL